MATFGVAAAKWGAAAFSSLAAGALGRGARLRAEQSMGGIMFQQAARFSKDIIKEAIVTEGRDWLGFSPSDGVSSAASGRAIMTEGPRAALKEMATASVGRYVGSVKKEHSVQPLSTKSWASNAFQRMQTMCRFPTNPSITSTSHIVQRNSFPNTFMNTFSSVPGVGPLMQVMLQSFMPMQKRGQPFLNSFAHGKAPVVSRVGVGTPSELEHKKRTLK